MNFRKALIAVLFISFVGAVAFLFFQKTESHRDSAGAIVDSRGSNEEVEPFFQDDNILDMNYALIQRRIASILEGEKNLEELSSQLQEDAEYLSLLTQISPPLSPVFFLLGQVELLLDEKEKAIEALERYVTLEPDSLWGRKLLALGQFRLGDRESARDNFQKVVFLQPLDLVAWKSLSEIYLESGDHESAIFALEQVRIIDPFDDHAIATLNRLYSLE